MIIRLFSLFIEVITAFVVLSFTFLAVFNQFAIFPIIEAK